MGGGIATLAYSAYIYLNDWAELNAQMYSSQGKLIIFVAFSRRREQTSKC